MLFCLHSKGSTDRVSSSKFVRTSCRQFVFDAIEGVKRQSLFTRPLLLRKSQNGELANNTPQHISYTRSRPLATMRLSCGTRTLPYRSQIVWERQFVAITPPAMFRGSQLGRKPPHRLLRRDYCLYRDQKFSTTTDAGIKSPQNAIDLQHYQFLQHITHSNRSLGVWEAVELFDDASRSRQKIGGSVWKSIYKLPEVSSAISNLKKDLPLASASNMMDSIQALERARQIFGSYQTGSVEHLACSALLAEFQNRCSLYSESAATLEELVPLCRKDGPLQEDLPDKIQIGLAKLHWLYGRHEKAKAICDDLVDQDRPIEAAARTGQAVSRLLFVSSLDDVFSVRDPFRMTIKDLERTVHPASTVLGAAYLNMGIAEAVWAETVSKHNNVDAPLDAAMRSWKQGLTTLKKGRSGTSRAGYRVGESSPLRSMLRARLLANMAWGMLQMTHQVDYLSRAMEYATESLSVYDAINPVVASASNESVDIGNQPIAVEKEGLGRTLSLLGSCYHLNGNAVTAQGLLQSSFDKVSIKFSSSPVTTASALQCVELRDAYQRYAQLCSDWEKRESEEEKMNQIASAIDKSVLPDGWSEKSSIHGSLWFWTPVIAERH
jgi:tetratricopeptide (TPR) repeat protein